MVIIKIALVGWDTVTILRYPNFTDIYCLFQGETQDFLVVYENVKAKMALPFFKDFGAAWLESLYTANIKPL